MDMRRQPGRMSSAQEIADAAAFAWARPMKQPRRVGVSVAVVIILMLIAHASFSVLAVKLLVR